MKLLIIIALGFYKGFHLSGMTEFSVHCIILTLRVISGSRADGVCGDVYNYLVHCLVQASEDEKRLIVCVCSVLVEIFLFIVSTIYLLYHVYSCLHCCCTGMNVSSVDTD